MVCRKPRPVRRLLKKGCEFKGFYKGGANLKKILILRPIVGGVNSVSGEKLHDLEIICPAPPPNIHTPLRTGLKPSTIHILQEYT